MNLKFHLTFQGLTMARNKHTKLSANTELNEKRKTRLKDFTRAIVKPFVSGWAFFRKPNCHTKDTPSFVFKNRGAVLTVVCIDDLKLLMICCVIWFVSWSVGYWIGIWKGRNSDR